MTAIAMFAWVVGALRLVWFRSTPVDRWFNWMIVGQAAAGTLMSPYVRRAMSDAVAYQARDVAVLIAIVGSIRIVAIWRAPRIPQIVADLTVAVSITTLVLVGNQARSRGLVMDQSAGWSVAVYCVAVAVPLIWCWIAVCTACVWEIRHVPSRREAAVCSVLITCGILSLTGFVAIVVAAIGQASGQRNWLSGLGWWTYRDSTWTFVGMTGCLAAVPVLMAASQRIGLDGWSRRRRKLLPLWRALTEVCPEIVYPTTEVFAGYRTRYLAHRTAVEIRDCLVILDRYVTARPPGVVAALSEVDLRTPTGEALARAVDLVSAVAAKRSEQPVQREAVPQRSLARDLRSDTDELLELAKVWPTACAIAALDEAPIATPGTSVPECSA